MGEHDRVESIVFADSDATASTDQQQPLTGIVLGFDVTYLHRPGDRTGFPLASAIKLDASQEAVPDVDEGDVRPRPRCKSGKGVPRGSDPSGAPRRGRRGVRPAHGWHPRIAPTTGLSRTVRLARERHRIQRGLRWTSLH